MPAYGPKKPIHATKADTTEAVEAFLATLEHPRLDEIRALRGIVLGADPSIAEGIKWNAPSFRTGEYFATFHLRQKTGLAMILHLGAKTRDARLGAGAIEDPDGLLQWLGPDRAMVGFADAAAIQTRAKAFQALLRRWIAFV